MVRLNPMFSCAFFSQPEFFRRSREAAKPRSREVIDLTTGNCQNARAARSGSGCSQALADVLPVFAPSRLRVRYMKCPV